MVEAACAAPRQLLSSEYVPVTGTSPTPNGARVGRVLRARFVEFTFTMGDPDLAVELVMPLDEFTSFCWERCCVVDAASVAAADAFAALLRTRPEFAGVFAPLPVVEERI